MAGAAVTPTRGPSCTAGCAAVPVDDLAAALEPGSARPTVVLHLDFHPFNIMLTADGPVVFDWTNAALGPPAADVALAWVIAATSTIDVPA